MFFTATGILFFMAVGVVLIGLAYYGFGVWRALDGSAVGFVIRVILPLVSSCVVLYLTFANMPVQIIGNQ